MTERFTIDGLTYEVDFSGDTINFVIVVGGANPVYDSDPYDPFDSPDDWSIEPRVTADIGGKYLFFKLKPGAASQEVLPAATDRRATA